MRGLYITKTCGLIGGCWHQFIDTPWSPTAFIDTLTRTKPTPTCETNGVLSWNSMHGGASCGAMCSCWLPTSTHTTAVLGAGASTSTYVRRLIERCLPKPKCDATERSSSTKAADALCQNPTTRMFVANASRCGHKDGSDQLPDSAWATALPALSNKC